MLLWALLVMVATIALFPETETGKFLRCLLIDEPAERLNRASPRRAFISVATFIILMAIAPMLIEAAVPVELALLMAGDMLIYIEALTLVGLVATQGRLRGAFKVVAIVGAATARRVIRPRARRSRPAMGSRTGRKDSEEGVSVWGSKRAWPVSALRQVV